MLLKSFAELPARKRVGIIGVILGVLSIFAGNPNDNVNTKVNIKELSMISAEQIGKINVEDLADNIIKSKYEYRLIDLRKTEDYSKYNIPTSENIPVDQLLKSDLSKNEKILLYSDNDIEAAQAWFLLKSDQYKSVNILEGGLKTWQSEILFPQCSCGENPTVEQKHKHDKLTEVSKYFGGNLQTNVVSNDNNPQMKMPELSAPTTITLKKTSGKRKREGC